IDDDDRHVLEKASTTAHVIVINKSDLPQMIEPTALNGARKVSVSAKTGEGLSDLRQAVGAFILERKTDLTDDSVLTNERQHEAARMGLNTALYTMNADLIAQMSCNPAIGGIAKGHLVREIDALGGVMGLAADEAGIQFRLLNTSRGPAVWSPRAQADKAGYRYVMRRILERTPNLFIKQAEVTEILFVASRVAGIELLDGRRVAAAAVVLTTGTFLNGLIHIG